MTLYYPVQSDQAIFNEHQIGRRIRLTNQLVPYGGLFQEQFAVGFQPNAA
jgi:hypothetical protein